MRSSMKEVTKRSVRIPLLLTPEEVRDLDDWQFSNRLRTRSDAIREMMRLSFEQWKKKVPASKDESGTPPKRQSEALDL